MLIISSWYLFEKKKGTPWYQGRYVPCGPPQLELVRYLGGCIPSSPFCSFLLLERSQATTKDRGHLIFPPPYPSHPIFFPFLGIPTNFHHRHIFIPITLVAVFTGDFTRSTPFFNLNSPLRRSVLSLPLSLDARVEASSFWSLAAFCSSRYVCCRENFPISCVSTTPDAALPAAIVDAAFASPS